MARPAPPPTLRINSTGNNETIPNGECLTAVHNFLLKRSDGTTAAEQFFGQKPRSMFAAILESVEIPLAPLSPPRRAVG